MSKYNLSEIMRNAHAMRKFQPAKYATFAMALTASWKMAKFTKSIEARRAEVVANREAKKQAEADRAERIEAARIANVAAMKVKREQAQAKRNEAIDRECKAYGYGRGDHYSSFSGWGNYCGD